MKAYVMAILALLLVWAPATVVIALLIDPFLWRLHLSGVARLSIAGAIGLCVGISSFRATLKKYRKKTPTKAILIVASVGLLVVLFLGYSVLTYPLISRYNYESSDRGWAAFEMPEKGVTLDGVEDDFRLYKQYKNDAQIYMLRTSKPCWDNIFLWRGNCTNRRWKIPYATPSTKPNYDWRAE